MPPLQDLVVYHSAHFLRGKNAANHLQRLGRFLQTCTTEQELLTLSVQVRTGPAYDDTRGQALIAEFTQRWGEPAVEIEAGGSGGDQLAHCWTPALDVDELLASLRPHFLFGAGRPPLPQLAVSLRVQFQLLGRGGAAVLPHQNWSRPNYEEDFFFLPHGYSEIWVDLGESSTLGALISFPFSAEAPEALDYLGFIQQHFPTTLSTASKHWHWWAVRKDGKQHYRRGALTAWGGVSAFKTRLAQAMAALAT